MIERFGMTVCEWVDKNRDLSRWLMFWVAMGVIGWVVEDWRLDHGYLPINPFVAAWRNR